MRKWFSLFLVVMLMADLAGCASVQKKFTRKKKERRVAASVYLQEEGAYQKKYSNEYYYKTHFTYFKTWQGELINQLGGNNKKVARCAQEAFGHLSEMNRYLVPEKQAELKPELDALSKIEKKIDAGTVSDSEIGPMRVELERIRRVVSNNFYFDKVKAQILPDAVELGDETVEPASE